MVEFLDANKQTSNPVPRISIHWMPPPENCYKVNFDAAMFDSLGCTGIRVVVRDHRGAIIEVQSCLL